MSKKPELIYFMSKKKQLFSYIAIENILIINISKIASNTYIFKNPVLVTAVLLLLNYVARLTACEQVCVCV